MRGRKPKPIMQALADGDTRKIGVNKLRARAAAEPVATRGLPSAPDHLNERALAAWEFWAEELADMNLDRRPDAQMLEGACVNYARAVQADMMLDVDGITVEESTLNDAGARVVLSVKKHPAVDISNSAWRQVRAFCSEFGLSPSARARLSIEKKDQSEDLATLLTGPRVARSAVQ